MIELLIDQFVVFGFVGCFGFWKYVFGSDTFLVYWLGLAGPRRVQSGLLV